MDASPIVAVCAGVAGALSARSVATHRKHEMIFLVLTTRGWAETVSVLPRGASEAWINAGVLDDTEVKRLREDGYALTIMAHWIDPHDREDVGSVMATMQEHHAAQPLFVEHPI
jgi:hypothetical protein